MNYCIHFNRFSIETPHNLLSCSTQYILMNRFISVCVCFHLSFEEKKVNTSCVKQSLLCVGSSHIYKVVVLIINGFCEWAYERMKGYFPKVCGKDALDKKLCVTLKYYSMRAILYQCNTYYCCCVWQFLVYSFTNQTLPDLDLVMVSYCNCINKFPFHIFIKI